MSAAPRCAICRRPGGTLFTMAFPPLGWKAGQHRYVHQSCLRAERVKAARNRRQLEQLELFKGALRRSGLVAIVAAALGGLLWVAVSWTYVVLP